MVTVTYFVILKSQLAQPVQTILLPVCKPFQIRIRLTEEFHLHLFELSGTECKVTRCDLVTERLTDLADTKRNLLSGCTLYILKVNENALCSLRTKVYHVLSILCYTLKCLEHQVKLTDFCKIMLTAGRTWNIVLCDELLHLLMAPSINTVSNVDAVLMRIILDDFICTETLVTFFTVHQWVTESPQMSAGNPCLRVHQNRTIYAYIIWRLLYKLLPPGFLYIILKLYSKITIVPCIGKAAVDLRTRIYESS